MTKRIQQLLRLFRAQYQQSQQNLQVVTIKENQIRAELKTLQNHVIAARQPELNDGSVMRSMGADIAWETWLEKSQTNLNLDLAKVLAKKETYIAHVRNHFGKVQTTEKMLKGYQQDLQKKLQDKTLDKTVLNSLLRNQ